MIQEYKALMIIRSIFDWSQSSNLILLSNPGYWHNVGLTTGCMKYPIFGQIVSDLLGKY